MDLLEADVQPANSAINKHANATIIKTYKTVLVFCISLLFLTVCAQICLLYGFQVRNSVIISVLSILLPITSFCIALICVAIGLKIGTSINDIARELREIYESNNFSNRLDLNSYRSCKNLVNEVNKLLMQIEHRNKKVDEISEVINRREEENQLLWLEIERNLCLAREEAEIDGLTQIYNRKSIEERLSREFSHAINTGKPLSVLMADIDHFKHVNDTYGHKVGDEVLRMFADILKESVRSDDIPARYGGEEFILVLPGTPAKAAQKIAERINRSFKEAVDEKLGSNYKGLKCTVSIGVADYPSCANEKDALIAAADTALYRAKEEGRNRVIYHTKTYAF